MKRLREYIARTEIDPATVRYAGWIHPPDLVVSVDYPLALWEAITEWLKDTKDQNCKVDLNDPLERLGAMALMVRQHELGHFYQFINNPLAESIQKLCMRRTLTQLGVARLLNIGGELKVKLPLREWRTNYSVSTEICLEIEKLEASAGNSKALVDALFFGPISDSLPDSLQAYVPDRWWHLICGKLRVQQAKSNVSFRDLQEGIAILYEMITINKLGISEGDYWNLRSKSSNRKHYFICEGIFSRLGGICEVTAAVVLGVACVLPALGIVRGVDDWQRFDALNCLMVVLQAVERLGPLAQHIQKDGAYEDYVRQIFDHCYGASCDPASLMDGAHLAVINAALGCNDEPPFEHSLEWTASIQREMATSHRARWADRFLPFSPVDKRWQPPLIWCSDKIARCCDPEMYYSTRLAHFLARMAEAMWKGDELQSVQQYGFGALSNSSDPREKLPDTPEAVLQYFAKRFTGLETPW